MNFRYSPDIGPLLSDVITRKPRADLHEIRRAHPTLRAMSLDQLAVRIGRITDQEHSR